jgi:Replication-relaxation
MDVGTRARGRLFERPEAPRPFRLTSRDLNILVNLARLRLASGEQLAALDGGSHQNVTRSLLALWENEYVERLLGQVERRVLYKGSFPLIYGLTRPGAWLLRKHGHDVRRRLLYETDKQRRAGWRFIEHRVDISEFMVRMELACRDRSELELVERREIVDKAPKTARDQRVRLTAKVRIDGTHQLLSVDPDEFFGLRNVSNGQVTYFMFERDRGEMPIHRRKDKDQTFFAKKMMTYLEANRVGEHVSELGIPNFRVLTVTATPERVQQMIEAQREISGGRGSNIFVFIDDASLLASNPLDALWLTGKGKQVRLTA